MLINKDVARKFYNLVLIVSRKTAIQAHEYLKSHEKLTGYFRYPIKNESLTLSTPETEELFQTIPFLMYNIPRYELKWFPSNLIHYGAIFENKERIDCSTLNEFTHVVEYVTSEPELKKIILGEDFETDLINKLKKIISEIVERYMYSIKACSTVPDDLEKKLEVFVAEKICYYLCSKLYIDIYVPICLATFDVDNFELTENIEIVRMTDDIQKSRRKLCSYDSSKDNYAAACATHMIVLKNYSLENSREFSISEALKNYKSYPIDKIDQIMAAIRLMTGIDIGYMQVLSSPIEWIDSFCADLIPMYGAKSYNINSNEIKDLWLELSVRVVTLEQLELIKEIVTFIIQEDKNKKGFDFALKCFNRCILRLEKDDKVVDAVTGLETLLLNDGSKGEITYKISNRISVVFANEYDKRYSSTNCRDIMRKIYNYRSKIVHGSTLKDSEKYYTINGENIEIEEIALDFLRYTLLFIIKNPEFLKDGKFENYIDDAILKYTKSSLGGE